MKNTYFYNQLIARFYNTVKMNKDKITIRESNREMSFSSLYCEVLLLSKKNFEIYIIKGINV